MQLQMFHEGLEGQPAIDSESGDLGSHPAVYEETIEGLVRTLKRDGCDRCILSHKGRNQIVVYRGNPNARFMIVGEAPGAEEDRCGLPFSGPAGQKLNQIIQSIDLDPEKDFYIGNIVKCRPIDHSGIKQNLTPTHKCAAACRPFILREIELVKPEVIICVGLTAARYIVDLPPNARMRQWSGKILDYKHSPDTKVLITYHPAAILHARRNPELQNYIRRRIWKDIKMFKGLYVEGKVDGTGGASIGGNT